MFCFWSSPKASPSKLHSTGSVIPAVLKNIFNLVLGPPPYRGRVRTVIFLRQS